MQINEVLEVRSLSKPSIAKNSSKDLYIFFSQFDMAA